MQRLKLGLVCLSWLIMASAVSAQTAGDPNSNSGVANVQNFSGGGVLNGTYFDVRQVIGDGVGWTNSYSQLGLFTPFYIGDDTIIAPNVRLIVTNSTQTGVNAGLVGRTYVDDLDRIFGVYGYYDNDQDAYNYRYNQFTVGAETLGTWWDLRANGYFVTGMNSNYMSAIGITGGPYYVGNNIAFAGQQLRDQALSGGDAEFGLPLSPYTKWLRGYAGIYGYQTGSNETMGFRGRIEATVSNDLTLGVMMTQDALFGTNINGMIDFKFSGFMPTRYFPNWTTRQRLLNPVQRNWRIATHTYVEQINVDAINPATNQPYFITHVNNAAAPGGNGTIEHPYQNLQSSPQANIILVHLGNANSQATAVTGSATLTDNQRLLGTGILSTVPLFAQYGGSTISGTFNLPGTSNSGLYPYVTNPGGNIVTLANNNEVAGLNLIGSGGTAITNTAAGSNNFNLHNLEIAQNAGYGINLTNASGSGILSSINTGTTNHANPLGIGNNALGGIQISTGAPGLNLQLSNVYMNSNPAATQAQGISLAAANGNLNAIFNNVFTNGNAGNGIQLSETNQNLFASLTSIQANGNGGVGVNVAGTGGSISLTSNDLVAVKNGSDNLDIGTQAAPVTDAVIVATLNNSNFSSSTGGSGVVFSGSGSYGTLNLNSSLVFGNSANGLAIYATNSSLMNAYVRNGNFTNNGMDAFHVVANTGATVNLAVDPTNATGSGNDGLYYNVGQNATFNATFRSTSLDNSGNSAVYGILANYALADLQMFQTTGANSGANGFYLNATNNSMATINIQDGTFQNSGRTVAGSSAVNISSDNSMVVITTDNTIAGQPANFSFGGNYSSTGVTGNQAYGLTLNLQDNSQFNGDFANGDFSKALTNAVNASVTSGSNAILTLFNTNGNNSGADGFVANVNNANLQANLTFSNLNNSGGNGANFTVANGGNMTANLYDSSINNSAVNGMLISETGVSQATINLINGSNINNSGNSGVNFNVNGSTLTLTDTSDSISNSGAGGVSGSGILGVVSNAGTANLNLLDMTINNNLDNGVFVTTNSSANVNAVFDLGSVSDNGLNSPNAATNFNDGIRLMMDSATNSSLQMFNGVTVNGNGNNGVTIDATDGTVFTGTLISSTIMNNGAGNTSVLQGAGVSVTSDTSSNVNLTMSGMTIDNTAAGGSQQYGLLTSSSNAGQLTLNMNSSILSNNAVDAINATATTTSTTSLSLFDTVADNSGATGALFSVTTGAILNFTDFSSGAINSASISSSGGSGIFAAVDGTGSVANFNFDGLNLNSNGSTFGGQGFFGLATNGANLNALIANSSIQGTSNQGIEIFDSGANTISRFNVLNTAVNNNGSEGLLINVSNNATSYYRSTNSQYESNGSNGILDGVQINATGTGALNSATAISLFTGDSIDTNTGNGFSLNVANGATLTTQMQSVDISSNGGFGIATSSDSNANTQFNLLMSGTNTLNNNTSGSINDLDFTGINQVVLQLAGNFSNTAGDGVHIDLQHIVNAAVAVNGPGTIDNSGGNGIFINMNNITNGSVLIDGLTEINNSLLDGIAVTFNTVSNGAIEIEGPTNINDNGGDAVDINLTNSNMVNGLNYGGAQIQILTLTNNFTPVPGNPALDNLLPDPVTVNLDSLGITPANALTIDSISATGNTQNGISVVGTATTIAANGSFITDNLVTGSKAGDGILVNLTGGTADDMTIAGNTLTGNSLNGLNVQLSNNPIAGLTIVNNTIQTNNLDGVRFDLNSSSLSNLDVSFNTISGNGVTGAGNGVEFTNTTGHVTNSDITNGLFESNTIANNKGSGISLVNPISANPANPISLEFANNIITGNTGTGVNLDLLNGDQSLAATFSGNTISLNSGGPGVNIQLNNDANLRVGFGTNLIDSNGAQGINIQTATLGIITGNFIGNTIDGNTSDGITIALGNSGQFNSASFYGNTIGTNTSPNGGLGVNLTVPDSASFNWNLGDVSQASNLISGNGGAGVGILMTGSATGTLIVENTSFSNTTKGKNANYNGEGLAVIEQGTSTLQGAIADSSFTNNTTDGAFFSVTGNGVGVFSQLQSLNIGNFGTSSFGNTFSNNGTNGLEFSRTADGEIGSVTPIQIGFSNFNSNSGNGLEITSANELHTDFYSINNNTFSNNGFNGVQFNEQADAQINANMTQNSITNNGANGIELTEKVNAASDHRQLSGVWTLNLITGNGGDGILLAGSVNGLVIGDPSNLLIGNMIAHNTLNGIEDTGTANGAGLTIGSNMIQFNGTPANLSTAAENAGILMNVAPSSSIIVENNIINNNFGDGVQYQISTRFDGATTQIQIVDNMITNNTGRGVNLINREDNTTQANISGNFISANGLEGVYVVNTASADQAIWATSTTPLLADGSVFADPNLQLRVVGNEIINNGFGSSLQGTGLVIRVGTSDGSTSDTDNGGFASAGAALAPGASWNTFLSTVSSTRGGVIAQVDNNALGGNFGNDIEFNSFTSTVNPITSAGTWANNLTATPPTFTFNLTAYQSDPLSRFDLYFRNNVTDPNSVDPLGADLGGYATRNPALVAFYNNAEPTFKSATGINTTAGGVVGPFLAADRARNATRQAADTIGGFVGSPPYLFPGIGASTWRVSTDSTGTAAAGFFNNLFLANPASNGEDSYTWGTF